MEYCCTYIFMHIFYFLSLSFFVVFTAGFGVDDDEK